MTYTNRPTPITVDLPCAMGTRLWAILKPSPESTPQVVTGILKSYAVNWGSDISFEFVTANPQISTKQYSVSAIGRVIFYTEAEEKYLVASL